MNPWISSVETESFEGRKTRHNVLKKVAIIVPEDSQRNESFSLFDTKQHHFLWQQPIKIKAVTRERVVL